MPVYLLSFSAGFLSLGIEILWVRLFVYANHSASQAFAFVLTCYLLGIAIGSDIGKRFCNSTYNLWFISGIALAMASLFDLTSPWIYTAYYTGSHPLILAMFLIAISSFLKAIVFPIAHHIGTLGASSGRNISKVYVSNIAGSTIGTLVMGLFLLAYFTAQQCFIISSALGFCVALFCLFSAVPKLYLSTASTGMLVALTVFWLLDSNTLIAKLSDSDMYRRIHHIVENQYGVVVTYYTPSKGDDIISGGNVYDGRTNLDPAVNSNGIDRVIMLAALNDHPANVLLIGLSVGTWLKLIESFNGVANIDVVEINSGYLQVIADYPTHAAALKDPRVHLYIDDGRRWLKAHPDSKYDLVVMNTSFHWRAYESNLLSKEFLSLLKQHMNKDAVLAYNTTDSPDAFKTGVSCFNHAYLYQNFCVAADFDWRKKLALKDAVSKLAALELDGKPLFHGDTKLIASFLSERLRSLADVEAFYTPMGRNIEIVTDRNLITEYKYGLSLF